MKITVNPAAEVVTFGYVPAGKYRLRVQKAPEHTQGQKSDYLHWEFALVDENIKATDGKSRPGHVFDNTMLREDIQGRLRALVEALGLEWNDFDTEETVGMEFDANLTLDEYQGNMKNVIGKYIPAAK